MKHDLESILYAWKEERGGKIPVPDEPRIAAYLDLMETLVFHGYTEEDIRSRSLANLAVELSHNANAKKAKGWKEGCERTWKRALVRFYPIETKQYDHDSADAERARVAEELSYREKEKTEIYTPHSEEEVSRMAPELDRSVLSKAPKPEVIYDPEMSKFLGYDNE